MQVAHLAKKAGIPRFLFAASCFIYGAGTKLDLDENDPLNPLTAYARSKIETNQAVSALADGNFTPTYLLQCHRLRPLAPVPYRPRRQ
jgi:nucleoside-diphosphate-sugar epimerase